MSDVPPIAFESNGGSKETVEVYPNFLTDRCAEPPKAVHHIVSSKEFLERTLWLLGDFDEFRNMRTMNDQRFSQAQVGLLYLEGEVLAMKVWIHRAILAAFAPL